MPKPVDDNSPILAKEGLPEDFVSDSMTVDGDSSRNDSTVKDAPANKRARIAVAAKAGEERPPTHNIPMVAADTSISSCKPDGDAASVLPHSPSLTSSPTAELASSEEESVAELGDVSEGECSSVEDFPVRRQDQLAPSMSQPAAMHHQDFSSGVVAVAQKISSAFPPPVSVRPVKCARFSEPADDAESLIDGQSATCHRHEPPDLSADSKNLKSSSLRKTSRVQIGGVTNNTSTSTLQHDHDSEEMLDHSPTSLPKFKHPRACMWTSSHAANSPSEDRSCSLVNVLMQPLPPNFDSETQLPPFQQEFSSLVRMSLWAVIDGHGGGCVATYASEVLLPHIAASVSRALGCAIVDRGVCEVNGQLRDANALDLDGLIKTSDDRTASKANSIHYRSPFEASDSEDEAGTEPLSSRPSRGRGDNHMSSSVADDDANESVIIPNQSHKNGKKKASKISEEMSVSSPLHLGRASPKGSEEDASMGRSASSHASVGQSGSSVKTSVKTAASPAVRDAAVGTHSASEVAAITRAITESFLAVDEGWINSIDPVATHQTSCQSNGRWNSGACALVVFTIQRLEWTSVADEAERERDMRGGAASHRAHDTSQNKDAARRRMLDYATRAKSASSISTISSTSSLTTTEDRVIASGLESEITETEGEDDDRSMNDVKPRHRNPARSGARNNSFPKETLISPPGGCSCHCYRAYDALLYTAHVGDCRAVLLGSAPPRTIKVHGSAAAHPETTDDESSHHSSDETECLSSSDHDADSSDDEDVDLDPKGSSRPSSTSKTTATPFVPYKGRPRRQSRRRSINEFGPNAPFIALPPLEGFRSVELEIDSEAEYNRKRNVAHRKGGIELSSDTSSNSSDDSRDIPPPIILPPSTRPIDLTTDHSAYNPAEVTAVLRRCNNAPRAISAGVGGGIKRVAGSLAVTRALGDAYLKTPLLSFFPYKRHAPYITARPEVNCRPVVKGVDSILVLSTDGVWERAGGEDVLRWVRNFYAEQLARAERRKNRRQNVLQPNTTNSNSNNTSGSNDGSEGNRNDDDSDDRNVHEQASRRRDHPARSPSPPAKRRKLDRRRGSALSGSTVADVIVRRVLNKVRRARNISSLHALMSLPPGRARRSKHDDITSCVIDLSAFVS